MINKDRLKENFRAVRVNSPLVHNITNYVAMNFSANALLAAWYSTCDQRQSRRGFSRAFPLAQVML